MSGEKILVIDDTKVICTGLRAVLEHEGYSVDTALSGEAGLEKIRDVKYDVIFVDLVMPGIDGIETCRAAKEINPETEIILMTGHIDIGLPEKEKAFIEAGGKTYGLYKPFEVEQILEAARKAILNKSG
ncbi:MAG: response regulator [Candidatus Omnitrophota bacterium]